MPATPMLRQPASPRPAARSSRRRWRIRILACSLGLTLGMAAPAARAADNIVFVSGAFRRSIPVADLEHLASTGQARGLLADVLRLSQQDPATIARLLNQSVTLPVVLVSRLLNTRIGEVLLQRLSQVIYPLNTSGLGLPALRAAVILGIADNDKGLSAISFLRAYPNQELAVSLPALMSVMGKARSITDLVRFFSDSPLDGLRGDTAETPTTPVSPVTPVTPVAPGGGEPAATAPARP